jgi:hypothetical protein
MLKNNCLLFTVVFFSISLTANAQDDLLKMLDEGEKKENEKVIATFKTTRIVNGHSIETVKGKTLDFRVTHHFGDVGGTAGGAHTLYGLDNAADIRIAFEYGINERLTTGFGRSKVGELLDGYLKFRLMQQTVNNKVPFAVTLFANAGFTPANGINGEYNIWAKRFSYTFQSLIARKFNSKFSFQLSPTLLYRNFLFDPDDKNALFSLGAGARYKITKSFALLADYFYTFSDIRQENNSIYSAPLGIGIEIETGGHVFHLFFTNNGAIVENNFIPNTTSAWKRGQYRFGFNISRVFSMARKSGSEKNTY